MVKTHKEIIDLWPSGQALAADLDEKYDTVMKWGYRGNIPAEKWQGVVCAAESRGLDVTYQLLAETVKGRSAA